MHALQGKHPFRTSSDTLFLLRNAHRLKLTPTELLYMQIVLGYWRDSSRLPYPNDRSVSSLLGVTPRSVRRIRKNLERRGYLEVIHRFEANSGRQTSNQVNPSGFVRALQALDTDAPRTEMSGEGGRWCPGEVDTDVRGEADTVVRGNRKQENRKQGNGNKDHTKRVKSEGCLAAPSLGDASRTEEGSDTELEDQGDRSVEATPGGHKGFVYAPYVPVQSASVVWSQSLLADGSQEEPMPDDFEQRKEAAARRLEATRAQHKKAKEAKLKRKRDKEQRRENLGGSKKIPRQRTLRALEEQWRAGLDQLYPNLVVAAWAGKERGQVWQIVEKYGVDLSQLIFKYFLANWETLCQRLFKKKSVPTVGTVLYFHETLALEAQQWSKFSEIEEEFKAKVDPEDMFSADPELMSRYAEARQEMVDLGILEKE